MKNPASSAGSVRLSERNRSSVVDCKYGFAFRTAEAPGTRRSETFRAHRTGENLRENAACNGCAVFEKRNRIFDRVFDIEKLRKSEQLKHFGYFRLNVEQDDIAAFRFYHFQKCGKRSYAGR